MIDHVLIDVINAMQQSLEAAMLEPLPNQEHFLLDIFLGDIHYDNSYALPGEINPTNLRVDVSLEWPVWSQSIYRSWSIGEGEPDSLEVGIELVIRAVSMISPVPKETIVASLDQRSSPQLSFLLERSSVISSENSIEGSDANEYELEISYDGSLVLEEATLTSSDEISNTLAPLGPWIASMLVRLSDQPIKFFPDNS